MLRRTSSASAAMLSSGYRQGHAAGPCTESLGSESGDVGGVEIEQLQLSAALFATDGPDDEAGNGDGMVAELRDSPGDRMRGERRLPPVMPRPAEGFMRAERRGGRLILTQVARPAERPREVFRATRSGGRLRLRFAEQDRCFDVDDEHKTTAAAPRSAEAGGCGKGVGFRPAASGGSPRSLDVGAGTGI